VTLPFDQGYGFVGPALPTLKGSIYAGRAATDDYDVHKTSLLVTNTNAINRVTLSVPGKKSIPPTLALPLEGGGLGGGEITVSFKMIIFF
jgi:hypothetical protein